MNSSTRSSSRSPESARPRAASTSIGGCQRFEPAALRSLSSVRRAKAFSTPETWSTRSGVAVAVGHLAHRGVDRLGHRQAQGLVGSRLDLARAPRALDGEAAQRVEQHGLADAAQAGEHEAAVGAAGGDALEHHLELGQLAVASRQLGRALAGAGGVGVPHGSTIGAYRGL